MQNKKQKKGDLGQHWTPTDVVKKMVEMIEAKSCDVLEPTAGSGRFVRYLEERSYKVKGIEIDSSVVPNDIKDRYDIIDFFKWEGPKFNVIVGNPPYVNGRLATCDVEKWQGVLPKTANLYLHVIEKCVKQHLQSGGEIIFIVPNTFFSGTSLGSQLRAWMADNGSFTHYLKPKAVWEKASIDTCIFRWVKGTKQEKVITDKGDMHMHLSNGMIKLVDFKPASCLGQFFSIGVGAAPSSKFASSQILGQSFISGGQLKYYDTTNYNSWPRWRLTPKQHKILVFPGPTRKTDVFYTTLEWDLEQSSRHTDHFLIPIKQVDNHILIEIAFQLNQFMKKYDEMLAIRCNGRWSSGIKDLINTPIDENLFRFFNSCGLLK